MNKIEVHSDIERCGVYLSSPSKKEINRYVLEKCDYDIQKLDPSVGNCNDPLMLLICLDDNITNGVIGSIVIFNRTRYNKSSTSIVYPWVCDQFEVGIRIFKSSNLGKGYGTSALLLACEYCKIYFGAGLAVLKVLPSNTRAISSYRKAGFVDWFIANVYGYNMLHMFKRL